MTMLPNTMNVDIGKGLMMNIDLERLGKADKAMAHAIYIGLRNILMDSHASVTKEDFPDDKARREAALAVAGKKLEAMYANDVSRKRVAREPVDPIGKEAMRIARAKLGTMLKGWQVDNVAAQEYMAKFAAAHEMVWTDAANPANNGDLRKEVYDAMIEAFADKPETRKTAEANIAKQAALAGPNLADLGLF